MSWSGLLDAMAAMSYWEVAAVILAILYVTLAARESVWCWPAAFVSTSIYFVLLFKSGLVFQTLLQLYYMGMAVYGWWHWRHPSSNYRELPITTWPVTTHLKVIFAVAAFALFMGWLLDSNTDSSLPYLDALTTWFAVLTTYMVAQKKLENWGYWIIIDSGGLYLFYHQGLYLTAFLMGIYIVLAIFGGWSWWTKYQQKDKAGA